MRVLVVEDDPGIALGVQEGLRLRGCVVDCAATVEEAWSALRLESFDLLLLDLGLPDQDGTELLRRLRKARAGRPDPLTPVLIMTARDQLASRVAGLDLGADDYLSKPFHIDELAARMRALRRRAVGRADARLHCGQIEIDPAQRQVWRQSQAVELTTREFDLLLALAEIRPRVLAKGRLETQLYSLDQAPESNAIEVHVHHLRRKLGTEVIRTLRGVGYFMPEDRC